MRNLITTIVLLLAAPPLFAGDELYIDLEYGYVLTRQTEGENIKHETPLVPRSEGRLRVTLGPRIVEIVEGARRRVFDFEMCRLLVVKVEDGTYSESSLLGVVGFLEIEMRNRVRMSAVLKAASKEMPSLEPLEMAALFGWSTASKEAPTKLTIEKTGGHLDGNGRTLVQWTESEHALPEALRGAYARFLHHYTSPHPAARAALANQPRLAAEIRLDQRNLGQRMCRVLTLESAKLTTKPPKSVEGLRRVFGKGPVADLARCVLRPDADQLAKRLDEEAFRKLSASARDRGHFEDAALLLLEWSLQSGEMPIADIRALMSDKESAPALQRLFRNVSIANSAPEQALRGFDAVDRKRLTHPYIVDVFRANTLTTLRRYDEARVLFLKTLKQAPWLSAAYKDLGDIAVRMFDTHTAWLCWEVGRKIAPEHKTWSSVNGWEKRLAKKFAAIL